MTPLRDVITITRQSPLDHSFALLFAHHMADMHADTPLGSIHMMPPDALAISEVAFFVTHRDGIPVAMGAIKTIEPHHGEVKSMHVLTQARGCGLSWRLLTHLIESMPVPAA